MHARVDLCIRILCICQFITVHRERYEYDGEHLYLTWAWSAFGIWLTPPHADAHSIVYLICAWCVHARNQRVWCAPLTQVLTKYLIYICTWCVCITNIFTSLLLDRFWHLAA